VTVANAPRYLAAGAAASWTVTATATQDGSAAAGLAISWTATAGLTLGQATGTTDAAGRATVAVSAGGLGGGVQASVTGCVWTTVCASALVFGVAPSQWVATIVSGAGQSVIASATLAPVTVQVTDLAGHPVEGAPVTVYQTVDAWEGPCPPIGRCASAPVLATSTQSMTTDSNGMISITPLEVPGVASVVNIAVATGTQGFVSLSLTKAP
jgi:hypothetical protein